MCFDERPCFLIADVLTPIPLKLGQPMRYDYEYEKKGSANLFGFLEPETGKRHLQVTARRTKRDFALIMKHLLTVLYPTATKVRLVLDNLNTHTVAALYDTFPAEEARSLARRLEFHFTPKHGSWLNAVELEFAALELISKTPEQQLDATKLNKAEEVIGGAFISDYQAAKVAEVGEQALYLPTPFIASEFATILSFGLSTIAAMGRNQLNTLLS